MAFTARPRGCDQGKGRGDETVEELWELKEIIVVMERWGNCPKEMSDDEEESTDEVEPQGEFDPVRLLRLVVAASSRPRLEVSMHDGNLNVEELIKWINTLDKYFYYEEVNKANKVKLIVPKLRGYTSIWWD